MYLFDFMHSFAIELLHWKEERERRREAMGNADGCSPSHASSWLGHSVGCWVMGWKRDAVARPAVTHTAQGGGTGLLGANPGVRSDSRQHPSFMPIPGMPGELLGMGGMTTSGVSPAPWRQGPPSTRGPVVCQEAKPAPLLCGLVRRRWRGGRRGCGSCCSAPWGSLHSAGCL